MPSIRASFPETLLVLALRDAVCRLWLNTAQTRPVQSQALCRRTDCNELKFSPAIALGERRSLSSVPVCALCLLLRAALWEALLSDDYPSGTGIRLAGLEEQRGGSGNVREGVTEAMPQLD